MTPKTISPIQYKAAKHSVENIKPVLKALQKVDAETLKGDIEAMSSLQSFKRTLTKINNEHQAVLDEGQRQYANRPIELIDKAAARLNSDIPKEIELEKAGLKARISTRDIKAKELLKKGFSDEEIDRVVPPVSSDEIALSCTRVAELEAESEAIQEFLADAPRFSTELLKNTQLSQSEEVVQ
ncbi:hypothetical protein [Methylobacter sp. BlB1]|uniref:hypothetical protein n=1 Tax=Methylobacter sp. BlB1 TaxID=2785914 RepID=UPI00189611BD|nr:hypothetical protein [Methylobacter sp. BlB1]MBF6649524.1 hypothetical protein [Methylobacter sp. BlB1]